MARAGLTSDRVTRAAADLADEAVALLDGYGVRALLGDPEMDVGRARERVARMLARELGVDPEALV